MADVSNLLPPQRADNADLVDHLVRTTRLSESEAAHVVSEVAHFWAETAPEFVARRHRELHGSGRKNPEVFAQIAGECAQRRFADQPRSERQLRRIVYG